MHHSFKKFSYWNLLSIILLLLLLLGAACNSAPSESEHDTSAESGEHDHEHEDDGRIPNDGAIIRIISPLDGASFNEGEAVVVEVQVENFELGVNGRHWHIYVDGSYLDDGIGYGVAVQHMFSKRTSAYLGYSSTDMLLAHRTQDTTGKYDYRGSESEAISFGMIHKF